MATTGLTRGMGSIFKECEHPESRWSKCPHEYKIRYRNAAGRQAEESGFSNQEQAKSRPAEVYHSRKNSPQSRRKAERIQKYGAMPFSAYAAAWLKGQRAQGPTSLRNIESILKIHLLPGLGSRRMGTFDHKVVEAFIESMERNGVGLGAQTNPFVRLTPRLRRAMCDGLPLSARGRSGGGRCLYRGGCRLTRPLRSATGRSSRGWRRRRGCRPWPHLPGSSRRRRC